MKETFREYAFLFSSPRSVIPVFFKKAMFKESIVVTKPNTPTYSPQAPERVFFPALPHEGGVRQIVFADACSLTLSRALFLKSKLKARQKIKLLRVLYPKFKKIFLYKIKKWTKIPLLKDKIHF